jgi:hypothetical protein
MLPRIDDDLHVEHFADDLLARLSAAPPSPRAERSSARGRRRLGMAATVAVVLALAGVAVLRALPLGGGGTPVAQAPHPPTAAMVLLSSATAAAHQAPLAPGEYLRVRMVRWSRGGDGRLRRVVFTSWMAADGSARFVIAPSRGSGFEPSDERCTPARCVLRTPDAQPEALRAARYGPGRGFTAAQLQRLPTTPVRLLAVLRARAGTGVGLSRDPWELGFPLLVAPVPPQVRAALYRGLALLPGVHRLGVERVGGRTGVALVRRVRVAGALVKRVIVVDPKTGSLLAAQATVDGRASDRRVYSAAVVPTTRPAP